MRSRHTPPKAVFTAIASAVFAVCLTARSDICLPALEDAVDLCLDRLIPALFPFLVINALILGSGAAGLCSDVCGRAFSRVFRLPASLCAPFFIGITSGFPAGADAVAKVRAAGGCGDRDAERAIALCSNAGPAFVIGGIGGMLGNAKTGAVIYAVQIASAALVARLTARGREPEHTVCPPPVAAGGSFTGAVRGAVVPMLNVCAFVILFAPATALVGTALILFGAPAWITGTLISAVELTNGSAYVCASLPTGIAAAVCGFAVSWSGLCVLAQTASVASEAGISVRRFIPYKLAQGAICAAVVALVNPT